jgi:glycosyltransferase involved in cell wall biosynthesis
MLEKANRIAFESKQNEHNSFVFQTLKIMKILQVITLGNSIGGAQIHVLDLAISLHERGHDVHVLTGTVGELNERLTKAGVSNGHLPTMRREIHPIEDVRCFFELRRFIRDFKPDIVASHSSKAGIIVRLVCFFLNIPNTFTVHGWSFEANASKINQWLYFVIEKIMGFFSCKLITVAFTGYDLGIKHHIVSPRKLVTVLNGVRDFRLNSPQKAADTEGGARPIELVMSARFQPQKDHETLIKALIPLKNEPFHLQLLGDGTETLGRIQSLVNESGLTDKVAFVGFTTDVVGYLQRADICVLISHSEGLPLSILEAMSLGLPILASNVGGIAKQVENGYNGYLVERNDVEDLTKKIKLLMNSPTLRREMGDNSRTFYEKEFKLDKMVDKTLAVYQSILK